MGVVVIAASSLLLNVQVLLDQSDHVAPPPPSPVHTGSAEGHAVLQRLGDVGDHRVEATRDVVQRRDGLVLRTPALARPLTVWTVHGGAVRAVVADLAADHVFEPGKWKGDASHGGSFLSRSNISCYRQPCSIKRVKTVSGVP